MLNPNDPQATPVTNDELQGAACSAGCKHGKNSGLLRALMYMPVILLVGSLAALATFPQLAEYATPLIGESNSGQATSSCAAKARAGGHCHSAMKTSGGCCSASAKPAGSCCSSHSTGCEASQPSCCSAASQAAVVDAEQPVDAELSSESKSEGPADAATAANVGSDSLTQTTSETPAETQSN